MAKPGLLFVYSNKKDGAKITDDAYHTWYKKHLKDIINIKEPSAPPAAIRYKIKSANDQAEHHMPFVALYPIADIDFTYSEGFKARPLEEEFNDINFDVRIYEEIQRFVPGTGERGNGKRGGLAISVGMTPGGGQAGEEDFEEWYRKQHLDMISMVTGYLRTNRYRFLRQHTKDLLQPEDSVLDSIPKYLAIHEYEVEESAVDKLKNLTINGSKPSGPPPEQLKQVVSTEWSKKVIGGAEKFEREVMEVFDEEIKGEKHAHL